MKVILNVDNQPHSEKPSTKETGAIQKRIGSLMTEITMEEFADLISFGHSFKAAALDGNKNADWVSQQVFAIDVDNDEKSIAKYGMLTPEAASERFTTLGVSPTFFYHSFSSEQDHPKFRLIFVTEQAITDVRIRNAIQMALMNIMPEADAACKDLSRLFHGSKYACIPVGGYEASINPYVLIQAMVSYIREQDPVNSARVIKSYCQSVGLNMVNGLPDVRLSDNNSDFEENTASPILYYRGGREIFNFNIVQEEAYKITVQGEGKKKLQKIKIETTKADYNEEIKRFDFDSLKRKCELWSDFINGTRWCYHDEIFGIASNMWRVKGAQTRMTEAVENNDDYTDKYNKINTIKSVASYGYAPKRCSDFCPYKDKCSNGGKNMLQVVNNKRNSIRQLEDTISKPLHDAEEELRQFVFQAYEAEDNKIYIAKAPTGIGKTTLLKELGIESNTLIAYPTHRLGDDIAERLEIPGAVHVRELDLEDKDVQAEYNRLHSIGAHKDAREYLDAYICNLISSTKQGSPERAEASREVAKINEYLETVNESKTTWKPILCTHKRLMTINNSNVEKIIIDEDIMQGSLIQTIDVNHVVLDILIKRAEELNAPITKGQLTTIKRACWKAVTNPGQAFRVESAFILNKAEINKITKAMKNRLSVSIKDILKIRAMASNTNGQVIGAIFNELPAKKCIILSATINVEVFKALYPNREVEVLDLGAVETEGKLVMHYGGFSRTYLTDNMDKAIEKVKNEAPGIDNIITFAKFENQFKKAGFNPICHYGACSGLDAYNGQDIVCIGTPHIDARVYALIATQIKPNLVIEEGIEFQNIKRNGYEFSFSTYSNQGIGTPTDNILQEIQFYLIQAELEQAVGRARILRKNATVHLFASYPLPGSILYKG